jgi:hypothetical protein
MTIDEMKALKSDTEKQICDLLMGFHDKTGMVISASGKGLCCEFARTGVFSWA